MANRKKKNPRTNFVICRVSNAEKIKLGVAARAQHLDLSVYLRKLIGLDEINT